MMKTNVLMVAVLAVMLGLTVGAQRGGRGPGGGPGLPPPPGGPRGRGPGGFGGRGGPDPVGETARALNLTPDQSERLRALLDARAQAGQRAEDVIQAKIDALVALQEKASPNAVDIAQSTQALRDAERARQTSDET